MPSREQLERVAELKGELQQLEEQLERERCDKPMHACAPVDPRHADFRFALGEQVVIAISGESGRVTARSDSMHAAPQYCVTYKANDGRACESWWAARDLEPA